MDKDRLIDVLLEEELGGLRPPDLTKRILDKQQRPRRNWAWIATAAAAACLIGGIIGAMLFLRDPGMVDPMKQTSVAAHGSYAERGKIYETAEAPRDLNLGGYCSVRMEPRSKLRVEGADRTEQVALLQGEVTCEVNSNIGTFTVRTDLGSVKVKGTKFKVRYDQGESVMNRNMWVNVLAGVVVVTGFALPREIKAGEEGMQGGTLSGVLVEKGENWIRVKADGTQEGERYTARWIGGAPNAGGGFDKEMLAQFKTLRISCRVKIKWVLEERRRVVELSVIEPSAKEGTSEGRVSAKGENFIDVTNENGVTERFMPRWIGGMPNAGGGFDKDMLRAFRETTVGSRVRVEWTYDERLRAVRLTVLEAAARAPEHRKTEPRREGDNPDANRHVPQREHNADPSNPHRTEKDAPQGIREAEPVF